MGRQLLFVLERWHETWNQVRAHPFPCAQPKHVPARHPHSRLLLPARFQCHVGSPYFHAFLESEEFEGQQEVHSDLTWVVGHSGMAHDFPENGGCPDPFSIVSGHLQKAHAKAWRCFGLEWIQLNSREQSRCQRNVKSRTAVSRRTKGAQISARCFAPWVWVILECEWSHNSPWTARESRGPLIYLLVAPRGTAAHVHRGCGHPLGALASASPHLFFVEPLCCPHHCQFVLCRWWCVAPLFLWARFGQVLFDVTTCRSKFVVHFCLIFFFRVPCRCDCASMTSFSAHTCWLVSTLFQQPKVE